MDAAGDLARNADMISDVLGRAAHLVENVGWSVGALARDEDGVEVEPYLASAKSFCAMGSIMRATADVGSRVPDEDWEAVRNGAFEALAYELNDLGWGSVGDWNDASGQTSGEVALVMLAARRWI